MADHEPDVPAEYDVLVLSGVSFFIDRPTRREIERFLGEGPAMYETLTIDDLTGAEVLVIRDNVNSIYSQSTDTRAKEKAIRAVIEREESRI